VSSVDTPTNPPPLDRERYWALSMQPLCVLVFLAPLILIYEAGSALFLTNADTGQLNATIRAHALFSHFFELFGVGGAFLPGVAMIVVLLLWHLLSKNTWRLRPRTLGLMVAESVAWTLPLLVLASATDRFRLAETVTFTDQSFGAGATIAIGAGLYEELLFRMILITFAHFVFVDLLSLKETTGRILAILVAAIAFMFYHHDWQTNYAFYAVAGAYLGTVYLYRGFGIVVATHAMYDLVLLL
jgi:membrane protease YdiL (CAAX protease family)